MSINKKFARWAINPKAGMFGDPNGDYAFCGIEPGRQGDSKIDKDELKKKNKVLIPNISHNERKLGHFGPDDVSYKKWPVGYWISKIITLLEYGSFKNDEEWKRKSSIYQKESLFLRDGCVFQMNLYPLPFSRVKSWKETGASKLTGFKEKRDYQCWCCRERYPRMRKFFLQDCTAHCLICFGEKNWSEFALMLGIPAPSKTKDVCHMNKIRGKKVFFIPFLGNGKISNRLLERCFVDG